MSGYVTYGISNWHIYMRRLHDQRGFWGFLSAGKIGGEIVTLIDANQQVFSVPNLRDEDCVQPERGPQQS